MMNTRITFASENEKQVMNVNDLSLDFAKRIVDLYKNLIGCNKEYIISKQILRSGTSIGANISESKYPARAGLFPHGRHSCTRRGSQGCPLHACFG